MTTHEHASATPQYTWVLFDLDDTLIDRVMDHPRPTLLHGGEIACTPFGGDSMPVKDRTEILLIRHAASTSSKEIPEADWPLSPAGIQQAQHLATALQH